MLRTAFFGLVLLIDTVISAFLAILVGIFNPYSKMNTKIMRIWGKILVWAAGVKLEVLGLENIQPGDSYIIVANHQSHMDIPVSMAALPLPIRIISKKELFKIPVFGWGMRAAGILEIDRSNRKKAIETLKKAEKIVRDNRLSILAFPEGTRSPEGKIHGFKKGPIILAINTGLPLLPVSVSGSRNILPKNTLRVSKGKIRVQIHPPVPTAELKIEQRNELVK
ncbi:MAG TPA: 1-acyl-sn-glycerol-3-phosphate acyltransferase, partial [Caldithrix sp.]|nr:1-acyl-sn-glycerol-3-phosphate acyltransferase [Caldithrix sp.]